MTEKPRQGQFGGGIFLAIGPFAGLAVGTAVGQPTIGLLAGIAIGTVLALAFWRFAR
ncbi:hypothetical protein [Parasphingopyxis lamellibrachiae]|uniref:Uncharacterized protein n=1 Tax=Parasphingopyxis lamellibrachiae TaxID=680125 RepID=A0A3D9FEE6_9SPHN|nr:hypothetical protein [Parasphingopyxis lamellibrachiae]RED16123.1 hypothetical protein DFR46_1137 [Parasphingopyxis lamellibrachiae]